MATEEVSFWNTKALDKMSSEEWESLCDGCGRCCLHKLEDIDTGLYFYTNVTCRLLDCETCRCTNYLQRRTLVRDCVLISPSDSDQYNWLPITCAYRRLAEDKSLEWWHPLISGDPETVHEAGISVRGRTVSEITVSTEQLEDHIISWIDF
ncbi:MAG TPA: YcgN family cysteine cluster protein [Gammaproteobacteria bacterium]|nr:YcgN family cysteine cluster protein [Gammaproteobacteria bacterium]